MDIKERSENSGKLVHEGNPGKAAHWHILAVVLTATFLAYVRTLSYEFVHDDFLQLVNNPAIHSWTYLPQYFTQHVWASVYPLSRGNYYRPVFLLWSRINEAMLGEQPGLWHLTTVLTHLLATALVYFLVLRVVRDRLTAGISALIFGLHPVHIEAVAWIAGVTEPLHAVFFIGAFLCYLKRRDNPERGRAWLSLSLILYLLAMFEKETGVVLPLVICAYEWIYGARSGGQTGGRMIFDRARRAIWLAIPYFVLIIPYMAARFLALKAFRYIFSPMPVKELLFTWPSLIWFWIKHLLAPVGLGTFYELRTVAHPNFSNFALPAVAVVVTAGLLWWSARRSAAAAFATAWLVLPLIPLLDLRVFARNDFAHDRYLYLPSVGLAMIVAMGIRRLAIGRSRLLGYPAAQLVASLLLALAVGFGTVLQSFYFENNWIFYRYNISFAPRNVYVTNDYAVILGRLGMYEEALKLFKRAADEDPSYWDPAYNIGYAYFKLEKMELAEQYFLKAIQIDPGRPDEYLDMGMVKMKQGRVEQAEALFRKAIRLNPQGKEYHYALGVALKIRGDFPSALKEFQAELALNPEHREARRRVAEIQKTLAHPEP